jgi:hypothetical protein
LSAWRLIGEATIDPTISLAELEAVRTGGPMTPEGISLRDYLAVKLFMASGWTTTLSADPRTAFLAAYDKADALLEALRARARTPTTPEVP